MASFDSSDNSFPAVSGSGEPGVLQNHAEESPFQPRIQPGLPQGGARDSFCEDPALIKGGHETMAKYLFIESRDTFDSVDAATYHTLAADLVKEGNEVTLFLVQNGVLPARPSTRSKALSDAAAAGVEVLADDFSLRERGINSEKLATGIKAAPLEIVIDQLADGRKAIFH
jgi:predicted peroxiredoxin